MAASYQSRFLGVMRYTEQAMKRLFSTLAAQVAREVTRRASPDGTVPRSAIADIQDAVSPLVTRMFLGRDRQGSRAPFVVMANGLVFPLSPYAAILLKQEEKAVTISVEQQAAIMHEHLRNAPDVLAVLQTARRNPFPQRVSEQFRPNPLAQYDPPHTWVDPRGYTLSERIWSTAGNTRRRLDLFLEQRIAAGDGALRISRDVETFLLPGRRLIRTSAPYGTDASYDAMRLMRTEITRAAAQASEAAAAMNPFVRGLSVVLSASHPKYDICDRAAAHGPWPLDDMPDWAKIPLHPHCLCHYQYEMVDNQQEILDELRDDVRAGRRATSLVGPLQVAQFVRLLLGGVSLVRGELRL